MATRRGLRDVVTGCKERGWSLKVLDQHSTISITTPIQEYGVVSIGLRHERKPVKTIRYDKVIESADDDFDARFIAAMVDLYDLVCYEEDRIHGHA